jgi:hypothetical protein
VVKNFELKEYSTQIDVSIYKPGVYYAKITFKEKIERRKIIKL